MRLGIERGRWLAVLGTVVCVLATSPLSARADDPELRPARIAPRWNQPAPAPRIEAIGERAREVTAAVEMSFEPRLVVYAQQVDFEAAGNAPAVSRRLAREFALSAADIAAARSSCASWGELTVALTLRAGIDFAITPGQLAALHRSGTAWTRLAHGLGLDIDDFVLAAQAGTDVAAGWSEADGLLPVIGPADDGNTAMRFDD
jgi:hypothetical protein